MNERTRIILGMSLIELQILEEIGGDLPPVASRRLADARGYINCLFDQYEPDAVMKMLPFDHRQLAKGVLKAKRVCAA